MTLLFEVTSNCIYKFMFIFDSYTKRNERRLFTWFFGLTPRQLCLEVGSILGANKKLVSQMRSNNQKVANNSSTKLCRSKWHQVHSTSSIYIERRYDKSLITTVKYPTTRHFLPKIFQTMHWHSKQLVLLIGLLSRVVIIRLFISIFS